MYVTKSGTERTILNDLLLSTKVPIRADEGVDLGALHIVELLHSFLDFGFGGLDIHQKHQSVDLLNLLHGGLCGHRALDDAVLVQLVPSRLHGLSRVFAIPGLEVEPCTPKRKHWCELGSSSDLKGLQVATHQSNE